MIGRTAWDAVVVGAGPAGCVGAAAIAAQGMRTLLVDRATFPRVKVCGGCLAPAGVQALRSAGLDGVLDAIGAHPLGGLALCAEGHSRSFPIKTYLTLERSRFDDALARACVERGVEFLDGVEARLTQDDGLELHRGSERVEIRAGAIVIADGLAGTALAGRDEFAWRINRGSPVGLGAIADTRPAHAIPESITMVCGPGGYVGAAPLPGDRWAIAAAVDPRLIRHSGPAGSIDDLLASCGMEPLAPSTVRWRGVGNLTRRRPRSRGRVLIVGDATGYVQPLTGEGMSWAMACAARLGPFAEAAASGEDVGMAWQLACRRTLRWRRQVCHLVCAGAGHTRLLARALRVAGGLPAAGWATRRLCWGPG